MRTPILPEMGIPRWRRVARWLLVLPLSMTALPIAYIALELLFAVGERAVRWVDASNLDVPVDALLSLESIVTVFGAAAVWLVPTALAIGFACGQRMTTAALWGFTLAILTTCSFVWFTHPSGSSLAPHLVVIVASAVVISSTLLSIRRPDIRNSLLFANLFAFGFLFVPSLQALAIAPKELAAPRKLWAVSLQRGTWEAMNTGSEFDSLRHIVFAGNRVIAVYEAGMEPYQGKQPMSEYKLVSLDLQTGAARNEESFVGRWGSMPHLYAGDKGSIIEKNGSLIQLHPDLTATERHLQIDRGRVVQMSPDGTTMAWETTPRITMLDASTFTATGTRLESSDLTSVSPRAILTDNIHWVRDYPKDRDFVTLIDQQGQQLLFHGGCAGRPQFLRSDRILINGCGKVRILNLNGRLLHETTIGRGVSFAGVSQDGRRFAVVSNTEGGGDPAFLLYEHFLIFDTDTDQPLAMVRMRHLPTRQSWSAFSPDGKLFAAGDPDELSLYQIP